MNPEVIRNLVHAQPFEPFEVHMSNGDVYAVRHPEQVFLAGNRLFIYYPENDRVAYCSLLHVANLFQPGRNSA